MCNNHRQKSRISNSLYLQKLYNFNKCIFLIESKDLFSTVSHSLQIENLSTVSW